MVRTRDGGTYQGDVTLSPAEKGLLVALAGGGSALVPLADLVSARFDAGTNTAADAADRFIVFRNSAVPLPAVIQRATTTDLELASAGRTFKVSTLDVAGILFQPGVPSQFPALLAGRPGVALRNGDFIDGEFQGFDGPRVVLSTVIFGIRRIEINKAAVAVVLHALTATAARYQVRTTAGGVFCSQLPPTIIDSDKRRVADPVLGDSPVPFNTVLEINRLPDPPR